MSEPTVLLVDDDPSLRELLGEQLEATGEYRVVGAGSAAEALHALSEHAIDVVVTALRMPGASGTQLCKDRALTVDLSSVGAGYMVDRVAERLEQFGIKSYMVELTGELKAVGRKPGDRPWRIAVEEPRDDNRVAQIIVSLDGEGVSTSGDYRNYFELDGQRFSHTFDARNGRPVMHRLASVTVLDPSAAKADGLSTVLMIMGEEA